MPNIFGRDEVVGIGAAGIVSDSIDTSKLVSPSSGKVNLTQFQITQISFPSLPSELYTNNVVGKGQVPVIPTNVFE
jgi:hypothetical protein